MAKPTNTNNTSATATPAEGRQLLTFEKREWVQPVLFMLSLSATGLRFYPALLFVILFLVKAFREDRYSFIVMLTLTVAGSGLIDPRVIPGVRFSDLAAIAALVLVFIYRKTPQVRATIGLLVIYLLALFVLATFSLESISLQLVSLRNYPMFVYFIVPVACFAGRDFDITLFFRKVILFSMIMCVFYILDAYIICGNLFVPLTKLWGDVQSTFYDLYWEPFKFHPLRKYPAGMFFVLLSVYPMLRYFKCPHWMWAVLVVAIICTQTFTLMLAVFITGLYLVAGRKRLVKYGFIAILGVVAVYFVDRALPKPDESSHGSALRVASSVDQFIDLFNAVDAEDLAEFGTGRMAQVIPKVDLVMREHRQWTGLGFLHPDKTKISRYVIDNEFYSDVTASEELAFEVEVIPVQVFLTIGYIGLVVHLLFLIALMVIVRRDRMAVYFNSVLFMCFVLGLSGFARLIDFQGLGICALAYAAVLLDHYRHKEA